MAFNAPFNRAINGRETKTVDFVIVGASIIGLTMAYELRKRYPTSSIAILEEETGLGFHASGRNSGVLHAGIYHSLEPNARSCTGKALWTPKTVAFDSKAILKWY